MVGCVLLLLFRGGCRRCCSRFVCLVVWGFCCRWFVRRVGGFFRLVGSCVLVVVGLGVGCFGVGVGCCVGVFGLLWLV